MLPLEPASRAVEELGDRVVTVLPLGLGQLGRGAGEHGVAAPGREQLVLPGRGVPGQVANPAHDQPTVIAWPFFGVNAVYSASAIWAPETQQRSWSSQIARG